MDFVTTLPVSMDWKGDCYDLILVLVDRLTMMGHYERVQVKLSYIRCVLVVLVHGLQRSTILERRFI